MFDRRILRVLPTLSLFVISVVLQGCAAKIDCNGEDEKKDVITILQQSLKTAPWYDEMIPAMSGEASITDVKTISKNDALKQAQCTAKYTFTYNKNQQQVDVEYQLAYLEDKKTVEVLAMADKAKAEVMFVAMKQAPIKNGVQKFFDAQTGKLIQTIDWLENKKLSQKSWTSDGKTQIIDIKWDGDKSNGWEKYIGKDGKLTKDLIWKDGRATGYQTSLFTDDGSPQELFTMKDGLYDGVHKQWSHDSPPNNLILEETFKSGKLDGLQRKYINGKLDSEVMYKAGDVVAASPAVDGAGAPNTSPAVEKCVTAKIDSFHKSEGMDTPINNVVLQEWTALCTK